MSQLPEKSSKRSRRPGFTLVEVAAGLLLLGTLLVGMLTANRQHTVQIRNAKLRQAAIAAADRLLCVWTSEGNWGNSRNNGMFAEDARFQWRWTVATRPELCRLSVAVGRLDVLPVENREAPPLVSIEILTDNVSSGTATVR